VLLLSLWLVGKAVGLRREGWAVPLLAAGTSPALLSFAVAGLPVVSCFLPWALALWVVLGREHRARDGCCASASRGAPAAREASSRRAAGRGLSLRAPPC
jgi:hypothetical protein